MNLIMVIYYVLCAYLIAMLFWNFLREKKKLSDSILYLLVIIPLLLRILRVK